jgi:hypothetical protein
MQKRMFATVLAVVVVYSASAQVQQRDEPPPPPKPPHVKKMRELPPPPPPPSEPPAPNAPPPPPTLANDLQIPHDYEAFLEKNSSVKSLGWTKNEVIVRLKSGKEERYNLNDGQSRKTAETKYGALPQAPPPPPPPPAPPAPPKPQKKKSTLS